jgi:hypothetical protein
MASGPSAERIQHDPAFVRVRENNREFGGAAAVARAFRTVFAPVISAMADTYLTGRLTAVFKKIIAAAPGVKGERPALLTHYMQLLTGFELNRQRPFAALFQNLISCFVSPQRDEVQLLISPFAPRQVVRAPAGATHFRIVLAAGLVPDHVYLPEADRYAPVYSLPLPPCAVLESAAIALDDTPVSGLTLTLPLPPEATTPGICVVVCAGIRFYQEVGGMMYEIEGRGMAVVGN